MSEKTLGYAPKMESLALRQITRPNHQKLVTIGFHVFDDGIDHVAHLDLRDDRKAVLNELVPQIVDERRGPFHDRCGQFRQLRLRYVPRGKVRDGALYSREDCDGGGFRKNAGSKKLGGGA